MHSFMIPLTIAILIFSLCVEMTECLSYPFQRFRFSPNSVCVSPKIFYAEEETGKESAFTMRNVPGEGSCMFLAVALTTAASMGLGGSNSLLKVFDSEIRNVVADVLSCPRGNLLIEKNRIIPASLLLASAAKSEGISPEEYINQVRNGQLHGGGPELTALANILRRPISIFELDEEEEMDSEIEILERYRIKRAGVFGDSFRDPCLSIPDSAVLSGLQPGAYSWHLHILVVDAGPNEKHACALLPQ